MKSLLILIALLSLVSCGSGGGGGSPVGGPNGTAGNRPVLLDMDGNELTSVSFDQILNPTYDSYLEMDLQLRNDGTHPGMTAAVINGEHAGNFEITSVDPKCNYEEELGVGETCTFKLRLNYIPGITPDGIKNANIEIYNADDLDNTVPVEGEVATM